MGDLLERTKRIRNLVLSGGLALALIGSGGMVAHADTPSGIDTGTTSTGTGVGQARYDPAYTAKACAALTGSTGSGFLGLYGSKEKKDGKVVTTQIRPVDGDYIPVVLVHGWTGDKDAFLGPVKLKSPDSKSSMTAPKNNQSLVGMLQSIPGAAVFDYDYSGQSTRWVQQTYAGLGKAIDCIYKQTGRKVIIAAHSMGGLNARLAVQDPAVAKAVSMIVTFGTPIKGSKIAREVHAVVTGNKDGVYSAIDPRDPNQWVAGFAKAFTSKKILRDGLSNVLSVCSQAGDAGHKKACLSSLITNFEGDAGRGLRVNSKQMQSVTAQRWPKGIKVVALYGDMDLSTLGGTNKNTHGDLLRNRELGKFSNYLYKAAKDLEPRRAKYLDLKHPGDLIVSKDSAQFDTHDTYSVTCALFDRNKKDKIHSETGIDPMSSACFHGHLMESIKLAKYAQKRISAQIKSELVSAKPDQIKSISNWTLTSENLGPVKIADYSQDVSKQTGTDYTRYISDWVANWNGSGEFCSASYIPLISGQHSVMVGFDAALDRRNTDPMNTNYFNQSVTKLWVQATGSSSIDATLPKTDKGIGVGSSVGALFDAYAPGTIAPEEGLSSGQLTETTNMVRSNSEASLGSDDHTYQIYGDGVYAAYDMGNVLNFKVSGGKVVGMEASSSWGVYQEPDYSCKMNNQKELLPF